MTDLYRLQRLEAINRSVTALVRDVEELTDPSALAAVLQLKARLITLRSQAHQRADSPTLRMMEQLYGPNQPRGDQGNGREPNLHGQNHAKSNQTQATLTGSKVPDRSGAEQPQKPQSGDTGEVLGLPGRNGGPARPVARGELHRPDLPTVGFPPVAKTPGQTDTGSANSLSYDEYGEPSGE